MADHTHIRIDVETKELLRRRAAEHGVSMASLLRELLSTPDGENAQGSPQGEWSELDSWWVRGLGEDM